MTTSRLPALATLVLTTILSASACSSSGQTPADPISASSSPSPTSEPSSSTAPSDWQVVALDDVAEISVPDDWTVKSTNKAIHTLLAPKDKAGLVPGWGTVNVGNLAGGDQAAELEESAQWAIANDYAGRKVKRLPNEVINGTDFFRLQFESGSDWYDVYGTVTSDAEHQIVIEWKFLKTLDRKQAEAIWSPVMQTFTML